MFLCNLLYESEDCNQLAVFQRWKLGREGGAMQGPLKLGRQKVCLWKWGHLGCCRQRRISRALFDMSAQRHDMEKINIHRRLRQRGLEKKSETPAKHIGTISIGTKACRVNWDRTRLISGFIFALASYFLNLQLKAWFWKFSQFPQDVENIIIWEGNAQRAYSLLGYFPLESCTF